MRRPCVVRSERGPQPAACAKLYGRKRIGITPRCCLLLQSREVLTEWVLLLENAGVHPARSHEQHGGVGVSPSERRPGVLALREMQETCPRARYSLKDLWERGVTADQDFHLAEE